MTKRVLILAGTSEASKLAHAANDRYGSAIDLITSLAGRLSPSKAVPGRLRVGGFGGAPGLTDFIVGEGVDFVIDATHPFAEVISKNAAVACTKTNTPRLAVVRPPWQPVSGDRWETVADLRAAALRLPDISRRAFLAVGRGGLEAFAGVDRVRLLIRLFEPISALPFAHDQCDVVVARPPFTEKGERDLLEKHRIDTVVIRNSGGSTDPKLAAARTVGARVLLARRPAPPLGDVVETVEAALQRLDQLVDQR